MVGIFDRSHYEDVLIHRVHNWATPDEITRRYRAINEFEARQTDAGTRIVKVMLKIETSSAEAPWYVVPANKKWFARIAVQQLVMSALSDLRLEWPKAEFDVDIERELVARS